MKLPNHRMGVHWIPAHQRNEDIDYIQKLKPFILKIVDPDPNLAKRALDWIDPNGYIWLRDWALSEQKSDMTKDPIGTGLRHANDWIQKLTVGRFKDLPTNRIIVSGINEPFVHNDNEENIVFEYTKAFLNRLTQADIKAAALNLSVGWPRNLGTDLPPYWIGFERLEDTINKGYHFLCTHEYWYSDPDESWYQDKFGWLAYRINACKMSVPIIIGECGMEKRVDIQRFKNEGLHSYGWQGNISAKQASEQLWRYASKVNPNVVAVLPFTTDWASHDWDSQDTLGSHNEILAQKKVYQFPSEWPVKVTDKPTEPDKPIIPNEAYWPIGTLTQYFGDARFVTPPHNGFDYAMPLGTELKAILGGIVQWVDYDDKGYGNYIRIYNERLNLDLFYAHLKEKPKFNIGDVVKSGQVIGLIGSTGNSTGPHLHLEIRLHKDKDNYSESSHGRGRSDPQFLKHLIENTDLI